jgi:hypothetical protein
MTNTGTPEDLLLEAARSAALFPDTAAWHSTERAGATDGSQHACLCSRRLPAAAAAAFLAEKETDTDAAAADLGRGVRGATDAAAPVH